MLYTLERGSKDNPPLVFLHGFLGESQDWLDLIKLLEKQYYCVAFDLPGHRQSLLPDPCPKDLFSYFNKEIIEMLNNKNIKDAIVIGYSMGGRVALNLVDQHKDHFKALVMISAHVGLDDPQEKQERYLSDLKWASELENSAFPAFLKRWYSQPIFSSLKNNPNMFRKLLIRRQFNNPLCLAKVLPSISLAKQPTTAKTLEKIMLPKLLICAEHDSKFFQLYKNISPDYRMIQNAGHAPHIENPEELVHSLYEFFDSIGYAHVETNK